MNIKSTGKLWDANELMTSPLWHWQATYRGLWVRRRHRRPLKRFCCHGYRISQWKKRGKTWNNGTVEAADNIWPSFSHGSQMITRPEWRNFTLLNFHPPTGSLWLHLCSNRCVINNNKSLFQSKSTLSHWTHQSHQSLYVAVKAAALSSVHIHTLNMKNHLLFLHFSQYSHSLTLLSHTGNRKHSCDTQQPFFLWSSAVTAEFRPLATDHNICRPALKFCLDVEFGNKQPFLFCSFRYGVTSLCQIRH